MEVTLQSPAEAGAVIEQRAKEARPVRRDRLSSSIPPDLGFSDISLAGAVVFAITLTCF